jgi:hypothetical protein
MITDHPNSITFHADSHLVNAGVDVGDGAQEPRAY